MPSGAAESTTPAPPAAPSEAVLEEVVVTGSSIAQKADSSPLPVVILTEADIAKTGLTSVSDLVQSLPAVQNVVAQSASVNGGGAGQTTVALHALPSKYTLVLVDGERVAPAALNNSNGGGFAVNIETIPLEAIERVEVLTDGASALYGADAVGGVVNFILKKDQTEGHAFYNVTVPGQPNGGAWNAGLTKGFGDLKSDGYNILFSYGHDVQNKLEASDRAVSRRGAYFPFSSGGTNYIFLNSTSNTEPANITLGQIGKSYSPYYIANGNCGNANAAPLVTAAGTTCRFNYAATVENVPNSVRDGGLIKGTFKVGDDTEIWAEIMMSQFDLTSQYAPPAQPLGISPTQLPALWNEYVVGNPLLAGQTVCTAAPCAAGTVSRGTLNYRAVSAGGRTDDFGTLARHISVGFDSKAWDWTFKGSVTASHSKITDTAAGGFLDFDIFQAAVESGAYNPVAGTGASSIKGAILHDQFTAQYSDLDSFKFNAQHKVLDLEGGPSILSLGAEYDLTKFKTDFDDLFLSQSGFSTQPASTDYPVGGGYGQIPFEADRTSYGLFAEWLLPFRSNLTVTGSARYDSYSKVHSAVVFGLTPDPVTGLYDQLPPASLGNTFAASTYKVSFRYTPIELLSFRGSIGTGFRAPALNDIAGALSYNASTAGSYACPFPGSVGCLPGSAQYDLLAGPNGNSGPSGLKPEKSKQYTFGVRVEPLPGLSLALDYWNVDVTNQVESQGIAENVAFNNPSQYQSLFVNPYQDPAGFPTIAFEQVPFNGGEAKYAGLDWNFSYRTNIGWGKLGIDWTGTYMLKQQYTDGPGLPVLTDMAVYGPDQQVVFKIVSQLALSLKTGAWTNTLLGHYKSGYTDETYTAGSAAVFLANPNGTLGAAVGFSGLKVPDFTTLDWQTALEVRDNLSLAVGIHNLTDKAPPLSLQTGGGGNQIGYDGRYYDPTGRAYYLRATFRF